MQHAQLALGHTAGNKQMQARQQLAARTHICGQQRLVEEGQRSQGAVKEPVWFAVCPPTQVHAVIKEQGVTARGLQLTQVCDCMGDLGSLLAVQVQHPALQQQTAECVCMGDMGSLLALQSEAPFCCSTTHPHEQAADWMIVQA